MFIEVATYYQQTNWSQQTIEQTKVFQEVVLPEVSKLNHAIMNKKQGDQMQFSPEKRLEKKMDSYSCQLIVPVIDNVIKWCNQIINFTRNLFIRLKIFIMRQRKNRAEMG